MANSPALTVIFLNLADGTFKAAMPENLQLRQLSPGKAALGVSESRVNAEGKTESMFTPLVNYDADISVPRKVELAADVPEGLKRTSKVRKPKVQ